MPKRNTTGQPTGTYVSRATYQKVCEENKKLKADLYALTMCNADDDDAAFNRYFYVFDKWREKFTKDAEFSDMMKDYAVQYFKDNIDKVPQFVKDNPPKSLYIKQSELVGTVSTGEDETVEVYEICHEDGCKRKATKDYNGKGHLVCDAHYKSLNDYFDEEYR